MSTVTVDLERGRRRASVSGRNVRVAASRRSAGRFLVPSLIASGDLVAFSVAAVVVGSPSVDAIVYGTCLGVVLVMTGGVPDAHEPDSDPRDPLPRGVRSGWRSFWSGSSSWCCRRSGTIAAHPRRWCPWRRSPRWCCQRVVA